MLPDTTIQLEMCWTELSLAIHQRSKLFPMCETESGHRLKTGREYFWLACPSLLAENLCLMFRMKLKISKIFFQKAFLSACHTADVRVEELLDEGIHIAGAWQLAGFSYVLATLWRVDDAHSVEVARDVYSGMVGPDMIHVDRSAESLHRAIRRLRE